MLGRKQLFKTLKEESKAHLRVEFNMWLYRHLAVAITKRYLREISGFFGEAEEEWEVRLKKAKEQDAYAWQTGHLHATNATVYGLDAAYPSRLQPELLREFRRISSRWHTWLGFMARGGTQEPLPDHTNERGGLMTTPTRKRIRDQLSDESLLSPETQRLKKMKIDLERLMEIRREEKMLREKYKV